MVRLRTAMLATAMGATLWATPPVLAHPHMFFDAQATFQLNDAGALQAVRVAFIVDEFNSLYTLTELGLDPDGDGALTPEEEIELAKAMRRGLSDYGFFTELSENGAPIALAPPSKGAAIMDGGQIVAQFDLPLAEPLDPSGRLLRLRLFDPTYFTEVAVVAPPVVQGGAEGACAVRFEKFQIDQAASEAKSMLSQLSREETPEDQSVGAMFADTAILVCDT